MRCFIVGESRSHIYWLSTKWHGSLLQHGNLACSVGRHLCYMQAVSIKAVSLDYSWSVVYNYMDEYAMHIQPLLCIYTTWMNAWCLYNCLLSMIDRCIPTTSVTRWCFYLYTIVLSGRWELLRLAFVDIRVISPNKWVFPLWVCVNLFKHMMILLLCCSIIF